MNKNKRKRVVAAGFRVGSAAEFLGLGQEEQMFLEIRLALANALRTQRAKAGWSQEALARRMKSSQSRVAKLEAGDPSVSIDLLLHALACLGCTRRQIGRVLGSSAA